LLLTLHREANVRPDSLRAIVEGLNRLDEGVVFPIHPRTRDALGVAGATLGAHISLIPPAGYLDFAALASQARVVLTDSGGVQKEAYWYGVPCVTLRDSTEWPETVEAGWNTLVATDAERLIAAVKNPSPPAERPPLYGDGHASDRIADLLYTISPR
nr:UDP-N-acetylglucosamine 2-epimerase [Actinomycetota bacterium]